MAQGDKINQYDKKDEKITTLTTFTTLRNLGDLKGLNLGVDTLAKDNEKLGVDTMDTSAKAQYDKVAARYDNAVGVDCHACFARS